MSAPQTPIDIKLARLERLHRLSHIRRFAKSYQETCADIDETLADVERLKRLHCRAPLTLVRPTKSVG